MARVRSSVFGGPARIYGSLSVLSRHGHDYGPFDITVWYPGSFPRPGAVPELYLRSHRHKWETGYDSHIENDWRLCLYVTLEADIDFSQCGALDELLNVAQLFLFKEYVYQKAMFRHLRFRDPKPEWPGDDRSHGVAGIREAIQAKGMPARTDSCPCGSGRRFKSCHRPLLMTKRGNR